MQTDATSPDRGRTITQRVGLWLGAALLIGLLILPPPESMRRAARLAFADQIAERVQRQSDRSTSAPAPDSTGYRETERQVVDAQARVMMAAAAVTACVACWWMTVALPIPVTSLLPLTLFPLVGVMPIRSAAAPYADPNVFLFMGGFIIALSLERWNLHRRIALHIVRLIGTSRSTIVLGVTLASAALSRWISNTAATLMMLPIGTAIVAAVVDLGPTDNPRQRANFSAALMLGIAYAASVGGVATPIGTPPNIAFRGIFAQEFADGPEISFAQWVVVFLPLVIVFLPVVWLVLVRVTCPVAKGRLPVGREVVRQELRKLGRLGGPERSVLAVFLTTAFLWMTRSIPIAGTNYGWSGYLERLLAAPELGTGVFQAGYINDATVALAMAVLLFIIPAGRGDDGRRRYLMNWETAQRLPWGILLLFGGGFSIAAGFKASGLSFWCGQVFAGIGLSSPLLLVMCTCLLMTFLTEFTSNTATTQVMLPILAQVSRSMGINPLMLMLPATVSASCAFMLPVATPPNAIVFGSGCIEMGRMVRTGFIINLIGVLLVTGTFYLVAVPLLGIDPTVLPDWAY
ncbi:MAG: SLC13/DASS family transporter [bacterium]|nr:SLC13/DASS family transporter [bacterium]